MVVLGAAQFEETVHAGRRAPVANWGYYADVQQARLLQVPGIRLERQQSCLLITLTHSPAFQVNSSVLTPSTAEILRRLSKILGEYDASLISVHGHTDDSGGTAVNQQLSEKRAVAVALFLRSQGVSPGRLVAIGHGSAAPVASNATTEGKEQNRRIELHLDPLGP